MSSNNSTALEPPNVIGNEIFERLREARRAEYAHALAVVRRLADPAACVQVTDGELADALFEFAMRLDVANPLLPLASTMLERFMLRAGIVETPRGLKPGMFGDTDR